MRSRTLQPTTEEQKRTFQKYIALVQTLAWVGYLTQVFSAMTESVSIYILTHDSFVEMIPNYAHHAGIISMLFGVVMIEGGLRVLLPYSVRAFLKEGSWAGLEAILSGMALLACISLYVISIYLSLDGSRKAPDVIIKDVQAVSTDSLDNQLAEKDEYFASQLTAKEAEIKKKYELQRSVIAAKYSAARKAKEEEIKKYRSRPQNYTSKIQDLKSEIAILTTKEGEEIIASQNAERSELEVEKRSLQVFVNGQKDLIRNKIEKINNANNKAESERNGRVESSGNNLVYLTIVCLILLLTCIIIEEIFNHKAGLEKVYEPTEYFFKQGLVSEAIQAIGEKAETGIRYAIRSIHASTKEPPLPFVPPIHHEIQDTEEGKLIYKVKFENGIHEQTGDHTKEVILPHMGGTYDHKGKKTTSTHSNRQPTYSDRKDDNRVEWSLTYDKGSDTYGFRSDKTNWTGDLDGLLDIFNEIRLMPEQQEFYKALVLRLKDLIIKNGIKVFLLSCQKCGKLYSTTSTRSKYCTDACKTASYEDRTGRTLFLNKKKGN